MMRRAQVMLFTLIILAAAVGVGAQPASLVKDIYPGASPRTISYNHSSLVRSGNLLYFISDAGGSGVELWRTDGTPAGTFLVADVSTGSTFSDPTFPPSLTDVNGKLFFASGSYDPRLWVTDGTSSGTVLLLHFEGYGFIGTLRKVGGSLFFFRQTSTGTTELWRSDGTVAGTVPIAPAGYPSAETAVLGSTLFFAAGDDTHGTELWKSDGTPGGTGLVTDIRPGILGSYPSKLFAFGGAVLFSAYDDQHSAELWKSDGTELGTVLLKDIADGPTGSDPGPFVSWNGIVFFSAADASSGRELWTTDGTEPGTTRVRDIRPGPGSSFPFVLTPGIDGLYFGANDGSTGAELWKSDGTPGGTLPVADILPGPASSIPSGLTLVNGVLYFTAVGPAGNRELWKSDGTGAGTLPVRAVFASSLTELQGALVFFGSENNIPAYESLWRSDGTAAGTNPYYGFGAPEGSSPQFITALGNEAFFEATGSEDGRQLWKTDGTPEETRMLTSFDFSPNSGVYLHTAGDHGFFISGGYLWAIAAGESQPVRLTSTSPNYFFGPLGTRLVFAIANSSTPELWWSDGTPSGTELITALPEGSGLKQVSAVAGGALYFFYAPNGSQEVLWKTNGTAVGTVPVKSLNSYSVSHEMIEFNGLLYFRDHFDFSGSVWKSDGTEAGTGPVIPLSGSGMAVVNGILFLGGNHPMTGPELWKTDGTLNGTFLVKDIWPGTTGSSPSQFVGLENVLYFVADDGVHGSELWRSDGSPEGTSLVLDVRDGSDSSAISGLTASGGLLFFSASTSGAGAELWKSDGTPAGTALARDINPGASSSSPDSLTNVNGLLYFAAFDPQAGRELWKSDGTPSGTVPVADLALSLNSSSPFPGVEKNGLLYFSATKGVGRELWKTDGTSGGTVPVKGLIPGGPGVPVRLGDKLVFAGTDGTHGRELWVSDGTDAGTVLLKDVNPGISSSTPFGLVRFVNKVFFTADDGVHGRLVWMTDGTATGTSLVKNPAPGSGGGNPFDLVVAGNFLFFFATAPTGLGSGTAVWRTDGTEAGTIVLGPWGYGTQLIPAFGAVYYLIGAPTGLELWKSDGSPGGTTKVQAIHPGLYANTSDDMAFSGGFLYFVAGLAGGELWKTDGSPSGAVLLKAGYAVLPHFLTDVNGTLFFMAHDGSHGNELWKSDGSPEGTVLVKDIYPGVIGSTLAVSSSGGFGPVTGPMFNAGGKLLLRANDGVHGLELWESDGTEPGTVLLQDIYPGTASSRPGQLLYNQDASRASHAGFVIAGTRIYFPAANPESGEELWSLPMSAVCAPPAAPTILSSGNPNCGAVTLDAGPGYAGYLWSTGETTRTITVSPSAATTYTVYVSNAAGCRSSASLVQVGKPVPAPPVASNSGPVCEGESLQLSASTVAGATYAWTGPGGFTSSEQSPLIPSASSSGTYSVTVTVDSCTSAPATTGVVVNPVPVATISKPSVVCAGQAANRASVPAAGPGAKYEWVITNGTITSGAGSSSVVFTSGASGTVQLGVTVTSGAGCSAESSADIATVACAAEPRGLVVDGSADGGLSDGNQVLEPGETVLMSPFWRNLGGSPLGLTGTASAFTGPVGAAYTLGDSTADYGSIAGGATGDCATATGDCYELSVSNPPTRPAGHWDAVVTETLSDGDPAKTWSLHIGQSFTDVPKTHTFYQFVERLLHSGVTTGCGPGTYCPEDLVSRLQMAIFIARAHAGGDGNVPASGTAQGSPYDCSPGGTSLFSDVEPTNPFCRHVHSIYGAGVTTGCEPGKYCPEPSVSRAQIAMFIARAMAGSDAAVPLTYGPDPATGRTYSCDAGTPNLHFTDVTTSDIFCRHTHYLWAKDVISGFPDNSYQPGSSVTRGAMAKFLSNGFSLRLYGP